MRLYFYWLIFAGLVGVIHWAGTRLTYTADVLGEKWNVQRSFVGVIMLSTVTSLPELGTSLSAVLIPKAPDLALGNLLGSNLFNVAILPLLAILYGKAYLYRANTSHSSTGHLVTLLYSVTGAGLLWNLSPRLATVTVPWDLSLASPIILGLYLVGIYFLFKQRSPEADEGQLSEAKKYASQNQTQITALFVGYALLVIFSGSGLSTVASELSAATGLGDTFFGSLFLAFATSLPEIVVSWAALRELDAVNLALGNVFGSCLFNLALIPLVDFFYPAGALLAVVESQHLVSITGGVMLVSLASYALLIRRERRASSSFPPELSTLLIIYLAAQYLLFFLR